jgi:hypothetical protein
MAEDQSPGGRGRRLVRRAGDTLKTATGALTGQNVEQQVAEYSEVYTQVLLGLHGDLELQGGKVEDHDREIDALKHQNASLRVIRTIAIAALALALLAVGVSLWTAL